MKMGQLGPLLDPGIQISRPMGSTMEPGTEEPSSEAH